MLLDWRRGRGRECAPAAPFRPLQGAPDELRSTYVRPDAASGPSTSPLEGSGAGGLNCVNAGARSSSPKSPSLPRRKCRRGIRRVATLREREHSASVASLSADPSFNFGAARCGAARLCQGTQVPSIDPRTSPSNNRWRGP